VKKIQMCLWLLVGMVAWTNSSYAGDAEAGKAKSVTCSACHGVDGNSLSSAYPKIAGQGERYLIKQITDIKEGRREALVMKGFVSALTETDIADIAAYFSSQSSTNGGATKELVELGKSIFLGGNSKTGVPACIACHGPSGKGMSAAGFPRLAGQHAAYTELQLGSFYSGTRKNEAGTIMRDIASRMHAKEIKAVASYIEGLK
jgi:cbb3-type cytochrome c oxidase subunit III